MDVNHERFNDYESQFMALAEEADNWESDEKPALDSMAMYLCLYGENGFSVEEEFEMLEALKHHAQNPESPLLRIDIEADYYQDVILFVK
jgi:hypothetical protein